MDWANYWTVGVYFATLALPFVMLFIVPKDRKPSSAIAWLLVIAILPWVGLFLFLALGNPRLPRQRRRRQQEMEDNVRAAIRTAMEDPIAQPWIGGHLAGGAGRVASLGENLGALPPFSGNSVEVLSDYDGIFHRMAEDIDAAQRFVHVQYYILASDPTTEPVLDALERAHERGIHVKVLLDHIGSRGYHRYPILMRRFKRAGISVERMLPLAPLAGKFSRPDLRNHRKIVVVDGDVGYVGSQNLIERAYRKDPGQKAKYRYLDIVARVRGPIVQQLDAVFRMDWYAETGQHIQDAPVVQQVAGDAVAQILPSGPGHRHENNLRVFNALLYQARDKVVIVNAYFVPDETFMMAITSAAQRGVEVHLVTPAAGNQQLLSHAQRSFYGDLLAAGVHVHLHPAPWNLHSKTMTIDDDVAVIGSSNLDNRSFELNLEVTMICYDLGVVSDLREVEASYMAECRAMTLREWQRLSAPRRLLDNLARLTSALQ